ncbi:MAG: maleylpyruvate isomerase family mycothiol-dependent enzyme [Deltaproteobacteria bacterium]|nr:maleylpyruvate isomerase family mycothiol-dependent enzyme [Deltaproteobacteria bacterium]
MDLFEVTVDARRSLLETFEQLDGDQWAVRSLCEEWSMKEMLAHLALAMRPPAGRFTAAIVRARGNFDKANHALAVADARRPVDELLADYRSALEYRFAPPGWPPAAPLSDILLHTLDVRIPLGLPTDQPAEHYEPVMGLLLGAFRRPFTRKQRPQVRWVATDHSWSRGEGREVRGAMADVALTAAGRGANVDRLEGDGVPAVRAWLG